MKRIDKWVARDGSEFKTEEDALRRELLLNRIEAIESFLPEKDESIDFANGHGYIQHTRNIDLCGKPFERACSEAIEHGVGEW